MEQSEVIRLILSKPFVVAKTMPGIPHEYTLQKNWGDDFDKYPEVVKFINDNGYKQKFYNRTYTYYDIGPYQYWAIGYVLNRAIKK